MSMSQIQAKLKAPKGQTNAFGKYKYRSCEDIVEAVKPILAQYDYHLRISDEIKVIADRVYVKATATVFKGREEVERASAYAREPLIKKGMDEAQITGATSSYARKYALNGLFAIDDTKDADAADNSKHQISTEPVNQAKVEGAYNAFKLIMDADTEEMDFMRVQEGYRRLTSDERIALFERFGSDKPEGCKKGYKAVLKSLLDMKAGDKQ